MAILTRLEIYLYCAFLPCFLPYGRMPAGDLKSSRLLVIPMRRQHHFHQVCVPPPPFHWSLFRLIPSPGKDRLVVPPNARCLKLGPSSGTVSSCLCSQNNRQSYLCVGVTFRVTTQVCTLTVLQSMSQIKN
jgi:hypothetical protein